MLRLAVSSLAAVVLTAAGPALEAGSPPTLAGDPNCKGCSSEWYAPHGHWHFMFSCATCEDGMTPDGPCVPCEGEVCEDCGEPLYAELGPNQDPCSDDLEECGVDRLGAEAAIEAQDVGSLAALLEISDRVRLDVDHRQLLLMACDGSSVAHRLSMPLGLIEKLMAIRAAGSDESALEG